VIISGARLLVALTTTLLPLAAHNTQLSGAARGL
jgi:hypothetical protein